MVLRTCVDDRYNDQFWHRSHPTPNRPDVEGSFRSREWGGSGAIRHANPLASIRVGYNTGHTSGSQVGPPNPTLAEWRSFALKMARSSPKLACVLYNARAIYFSLEKSPNHMFRQRCQNCLLSSLSPLFLLVPREMLRVPIIRCQNYEEVREGRQAWWSKEREGLGDYSLSLQQLSPVAVWPTNSTRLNT